MSDPTELGLIELRAAIDARRLSCRELMQATLARIDAVNPVHNAIVARIDADALLQQAARCDEASDPADGAGRGVLHGIPQAIKDTTASRGIRTTLGSPLFAANVPTVDAVVVARARAAGAILIGKTNVPEFGLGSHSYNAVYGVTRNAWDPALSAGGSSGGASVAVATGMLAVADGSDMMGSLRNPAAFNRVVGFRPSQGLIPNHPAPEQFLHRLGTTGPIARSVEDLALLLSVQAGVDRRDPQSLDGDGRPFAAFACDAVGTDDARALLPRPAHGGPLRIGWLGDLGGHLAIEPGILADCEAALATFAALGCAVEPIPLGFDCAAIWDSWMKTRGFAVAGAYGGLYADPERRRQMKPEAVWEVENGLALKTADVQRAGVVRSAFYQHWLDLFARHDLLVLPTAQVHPFAADRHWPDRIAGRAMDTYHRWMEVVIYPTLTGSPALSLPVPGSRLAGFQLIGAPRGDLDVLRAGVAYQRAVVGPRGWPRVSAMPPNSRSPSASAT